MTFAAAGSRHPVAAEAVGEVLGALVEHGVAPDLVAVFASGAHAEFLGETTAAVRAVLGPRALLGGSGPAVRAGDQVLDDVPALAVWAGWGVRARAVRLEAVAPGRAPADDAAEDAAEAVATVAGADVGSTVVVLADPATFATEAFLGGLGAARPDLTVAGGLVRPGGSPGPGTLVLDGAVHRTGAVGVVVDGATAVVDQGCRPVGPPMAVTRAEGGYLLELAGRPALEQLRAVAGSLSAGDGSRLARHPHLGVAVDERRPELRPGDFLVRPLLGADHRRGVLAVGVPVPVGTTVRFHVPDPTATPLGDLLAGVHGGGALVFRGDGAATVGGGGPAAGVAATLGTEAVAGLSCAGVLGPVGGRSFLHGASASVLVLQD